MIRSSASGSVARKYSPPLRSAIRRSTFSSELVSRSGVRPWRQMNPSSSPLVSGALTPMVWIRTPMARAASAATKGPGDPVLFAPSVISTMALARLGQILELAEAERECGADAGAVGELADLHPAEHLAQQLGVGRERCLQEGAAGEDHQAEEVALAPPGEVAQHLARHLQPVARA